MSHDLINDSIFHLNNDNAAFQVHMTDIFKALWGWPWRPFLMRLARVSVCGLGVF